MQTLGLTGTAAAAHPRQEPPASSLAVVIAGGFALVPLSVLFGIIDE